MDDFDLRGAFQEQAKKIHLDVDPAFDLELSGLNTNLRETLMMRGKAIGKEYGTLPEGSVKEDLRIKYEEIARWLNDLDAADRMTDEDQQRASISQIRENARKTFWKWAGKRTSEEEDLHRTEKKYRRMKDSERMGAGAKRQGRIKNEINFLMSNYSPANDVKIEQLIDRWRTSGDPDYDPAIKLRLRQLRGKTTKFQEPI
jgi:hypothetical protein